MKNKIVIPCILAYIFCTLFFIGCNKNTMDKIYDNDSEISRSTDTYSVDKSEETIDGNYYSGKLIISGSNTIWSFNSDKDFSIEVPYNFSIKNEKAKLVLISPDDNITTLLECTSNSSAPPTGVITIPIKKGENRIKIVGYKKSEIELTLQIPYGEFDKIS